MGTCKCKICGKRLNTAYAYRMTYESKNAYFCTEEDSREFLKQKALQKNDKMLWDMLFDYVKYEILHYTQEQKLPKYMITRLQEMRNGFIMNRETRKVEKKSEGYSMEVLLETFKGENDNIQYFIRTKHFDNERQMINYIMAIIDGNVNNYYKKWVRDREVEKQLKAIAENTDTVAFDIGFNMEEPVRTIKPKTNNLSAFLD